MENITLTDIQGRARFFHDAVLINLDYWQRWVENKAADVAALDRERTVIIRAISFALDLEEAWSSAQALIVSFAPFMERRGYWDAWNWILERAINVAQQHGDIAGVANLSALLARLLYRQSRFKESTAYYRQAIRTSRQIGDQFGEARACTNLGYFYVEKGYWRRAEVLCCYALQIFEQIESNHGRAHTENHLGLLYTWQGQWDKARQHLERACAIWQAMGDNHGLMYGFMNLGLLYVEMGNPAEALLYSTQALHQAELTGEELEIGRIYVNMGLAYNLQGELSQAEMYTRQAETIFRRFFNLPGIVDTLENLGGVYLEQQKWPEAIQCLESALEARRTLSHKSDEIQVLIYLAHVELTRGNQERASIWLKEAEHQLSEHSQAGRYYQLHAQADKLRRSLTELVACQAAAG